jgi:hypothetical protein
MTAAHVTLILVAMVARYDVLSDALSDATTDSEHHAIMAELDTIAGWFEARGLDIDAAVAECSALY